MSDTQNEALSTTQDFLVETISRYVGQKFIHIEESNITRVPTSTIQKLEKFIRDVSVLRVTAKREPEEDKKLALQRDPEKEAAYQELKRVQLKEQALAFTRHTQLAEEISRELISFSSNTLSEQDKTMSAAVNLVSQYLMSIPKIEQGHSSTSLLKARLQSIQMGLENAVQREGFKIGILNPKQSSLKEQLMVARAEVEAQPLLSERTR